MELFGHGLRRLGLRPTDLTDTPPAEYARTVAWARALHGAMPEADGLVWMSRQFNAAKALVLFGDRVGQDVLEMVGPPLRLRLGPGRVWVNEAANRAGIVVV